MTPELLAPILSTCVKLSAEASLTGDVNAELVLNILAAVVQDALVGALVLLLEVLNAQDDGARLTVGPCLEAASLALRGQVFEALGRERNKIIEINPGKWKRS